MTFTIATPINGNLYSLAVAMMHSEQKAIEYIELITSNAVKEALRKERDLVKINTDILAKNQQIVAAPAVCPEALINGMTNAIREVHRDNLSNISNVYTPIMQNSYAMTQNAMQRNSEIAEIYNNSLHEQIRTLNNQIRTLNAQIDKQNEAIQKLIKIINQLDKERQGNN